MIEEADKVEVIAEVSWPKMNEREWLVALDSSIRYLFETGDSNPLRSAWQGMRSQVLIPALASSGI